MFLQQMIQIPFTPGQFHLIMLGLFLKFHNRKPEAFPLCKRRKIRGFLNCLLGTSESILKGFDCDNTSENTGIHEFHRLCILYKQQLKPSRLQWLQVMPSSMTNRSSCLFPSPAGFTLFFVKAGYAIFTASFLPLHYRI